MIFDSIIAKTCQNKNQTFENILAPQNLWNFDVKLQSTPIYKK